MFASFNYHLNKDEYARGLRIISIALSTLDPHRLRRGIIQLAFLGFVLGIVSFQWPWSSQAVLLALLLVVVGFCVMQGRHLTHWHSLSYDPDHAGATVQADEDGISSRMQGAHHHWAWTELRQIHELPEAIILQFADWHTINLPKRLWTDTAVEREFVNRVRSSSPDLRPDLPAELRIPRAAINLISLGSFAAALTAIALPHLLVALFGTPIRRALGDNLSHQAVFFAILVTASIILAWVTGTLMKAQLRRAESAPAHLPGISVSSYRCSDRSNCRQRGLEAVWVLARQITL